MIRKTWFQRESPVPKPVLLGVVGVAAFMLALWLYPMVVVPQGQLSPDIIARVTLEDKLRQTVAQIFGGGFFVLTAYLTWRTVQATEKNVHVAQMNLQVSTDKAITDRLTKATENLENEKLSVRLGAIYALERIARDSEQDHWAVMEVLSCFVRETVPRLPKSSADDDYEHGPLTFRSFIMGPETPADVQAILKVIGRRRWSESEPTNIGLSLTEIPHVHLAGANLHRIGFIGCNMSKAVLTGADLSGACLHITDLTEAWLNGTNLEGAILTGADLTGAIGLTQVQIDMAYTDEHTKVSPPLHVPTNRTTASSDG